MQSIKLKFAKYLELGGPKNALHGVIKLPLYLFFIIALSGCSWFADNRIVVKPEPEPVDSRYRWMTLAKFVEKHFDTTNWTTEEVAAELSLAYDNYLSNKEAEKTAVAKPKSSGF